MEIVLLYVSLLKTKDPGFLSGLWRTMSVCPEGKWMPPVESIANALPHSRQKALDIVSFRLISEWLKHNAQLSLISRNSIRHLTFH